jgi:hypothetical protein
MSAIIDTKASSKAEVKKQLELMTRPHEKSCQALGDVTKPNHNDGRQIHKDFHVPPLHKWLHKQAKRDKPIANYPRAFIDNIVYTTERDLELLEALAGEVNYDPSTPQVSHEALERYPPLRGKMMEWIADDPYRVKEMRAVGGTDAFMHGEPGGGKTTLAGSLAYWRMEVNNETAIWAESVDESGTNERTEWLFLAPYATLAIPAGMDTRVRIVPEDSTVPAFEVDVEDIARDVIRYESVQDFTRQLMPGQFYVVFPDPLHRGCKEVSKHNFFSYEDVTPRGEDGPDQPTDADQWWFAFFAHRISGDVFVHPTFINFDEAGNIFDPDASKDIHQHYEKIKWFRNKYADARKKGLSIGYQAHALAEVHKFARQKIRWRITMPGNQPPIGRTLPGDRTCPLETDLTSGMDSGKAIIWKSPHWADIKWPNLKRKPHPKQKNKTLRLDAEVSIDFTNWQNAVGGAA